MFEAIKEAFETGSCEFDVATVTAFCDKEIAALDAKAAKAKERAATKKAEGDELMGQVRDALTGEFKTIADIAAAVAEVNADATVSKVTYRLTKLVEAGDAEKTDVTIPGVDGAKARKVKAFRAILAD
jgi:glutathione S-transferase